MPEVNRATAIGEWTPSTNALKLTITGRKGYLIDWLLAIPYLHSRWGINKRESIKNKCWKRKLIKRLRDKEEILDE